MRWLSPLLLVSLGLHGLGLLMPVPREAEVPEDVEDLTLESIQVSILPAEPLSDIALDIPAGPASPPAVVQPPVIEPAILEPALEPPVQPEPLLEPSPVSQPEPQLEPQQSTAPTSSEPLGSDKLTKPSSSTPQNFDPANADASNPSIYTAFAKTIQEVDDTLVVGNIREAYELDYLGDLCFRDKESVTGVVGVILNNTPQVQVGETIAGTGFAATNAAIDGWFASLKDGGEGDTAEVESAFGESLYDWIYNQKNRVWFVENNNYEAYYLKVNINLVNNPCK